MDVVGTMGFKGRLCVSVILGFLLPISFQRERQMHRAVPRICKTDFDTFMNSVRWHNAFNKMGLNSYSGGVSPS